MTFHSANGYAVSAPVVQKSTIEEMNMTKHTPTPWVHIELSHSQAIYAQAHHSDLYGDRIAELPQWGNAERGVARAKANAAFIVEAVNAHHDYKDALEQISKFFINKDGDCGGRAVELAQEALAKHKRST